MNRRTLWISWTLPAAFILSLTIWMAQLARRSESAPYAPGQGAAPASGALFAQASTVSVKDFGAKGNGTDDDSAAIQRAIDSAAQSGATLFFPAGVYAVRSQAKHGGGCSSGHSIWFAMRGLRIHGAGRDQSTIEVALPSGHLLTSYGSLQISNIAFRREEVAQNSTWKAINIDYGNCRPSAAQRAPAPMTLSVDNVVIDGFDIGVYCDGDEDAWISSARVTNCDITVNRRGTGSSSSVRPTVNLNNARAVEISNNVLQTDDLGSVNNIYCIGSREVVVRDNRIVGGIGAKIDSNRINTVNRILIQNNLFDNSAQAIQFHTDVNPIESTLIEGNTIRGSRAVDRAAAATIVFASYKKAGKADYGPIVIRNNTFRDIATGAIVFATGKGIVVEDVLLEGNRYINWSTASPGTYAVVATQSSLEGSGLNITARNEVADGKGKGAAYMPPGVNLFRRSAFSNITERNITLPNARPMNK